MSSESADKSHFQPKAAYFDPERNTWILSRYADVRAAFHEANLWLVGPEGAGMPDAEARTAQAQVRSQAIAAFPAGKLEQWEVEFETLASRICAVIPTSRPVDVAAELAFPWGLQFALRVTGAAPAEAQRLSALAAKVTAGTARPEDGELKNTAAAAGEELDRALAASPPPMAGATFVALSQTLPCLLANGWLLLVDHPRELEKLRSDAKLLPRAVEEILRLGGLAQVLHRRAIADVMVGDLKIQRGQRVDLMVQVANQDKSQFPAGSFLDFDSSPRHGSHFALGAGHHSCAAAALIRMAVGVATKVFVQFFEPYADADPVEWRGGSGFRWPAKVYAQRRP